MIDAPVTARVAELFTGVYELLLQILTRYYIHHGETAAELDTLARTAKQLMNFGLGELGPVLTALPVGPFPPGRTVGPTFDIARPAIVMLPHREAAWKIIKERLDILGETCGSLGKEPGLSALDQLAERLGSMSQDVEQRLAERTAHARA